MLLPSSGIEEENGAGAVSGAVHFYSVNDASGPEHQLAGPERGGNGGIGRCVFRLNVTAAPAIPAGVTHWPAAMRFRIEGLANREQAVARPEFPQTGLANHLFAAVQIEWLQEYAVRDSREPLSRSTNAHKPLRARVERLQVGVADGPIVACGAALKVALAEAPGERVPK